jgi:rRNA maturation endonuclease Nob1
MNEYQIDCEICESIVIVYNEVEDEPCFCPMCGSHLEQTEVNDLV